MKRFLYDNSPIFLFIVILIVWQLCASWLPPFNFFFGSPVEIFLSFVQHTRSGQLIIDVLTTGFEAMVGFVLGIAFGTITGFVLWYSPLVAHMMRPYIVIIGTIPVFAFAPMIIIWFGIGLGMKIVMATIGVGLVALTQAYEGAKSIDVEEFRLLKLFGATRFQMFRFVIFPSSLSWVLAS
jgi:NitT/TauT family transport system permease protein